MPVDLRAEVVIWAKWAVAHKSLFEYVEFRPDHDFYIPTPTHLLVNDCSATSIWVLWAAGAPEPFPGAYQGLGNTESFGQLEHVTDPLGGDFVVYGLGLPLGVQHMATVLEPGPNPMTMSHGMPSEPAFVRAIEGCPPLAQGRITYVRCLPVTPPAPTPTEEPMQFMAKSWNGAATLMYDVGSHGAWGITSADQVTWYKAKNIPVLTGMPADVLSTFHRTDNDKLDAELVAFADVAHLAD